MASRKPGVCRSSMCDHSSTEVGRIIIARPRRCVTSNLSLPSEPRCRGRHTLAVSLEAGKPVAAETYRRVAVELGLDGGAYPDARYIATPEEAADRVIRPLEKIEKTSIRVPILRVTDPHQILRLFDPDTILFDDSNIEVEHLELCTQGKQLLMDWRDIQMPMSL
jgi:hypothetical protein